MTQIINTNQDCEKQYNISERVYEVDTPNYDYCYNLKVEVFEKIEINDYNNPDKECLTIETWYSNHQPVLKAYFNCEIDGPVHPYKVEILDASAIYDILPLLAQKINLFEQGD